MAYDIPTRFHKVLSRNRADKNVWKNNNSEKETKISNTSPDWSRGDVIKETQY
jgi:hypothetical protein